MSKKASHDLIEPPVNVPLHEYCRLFTHVIDPLQSALKTITTMAESFAKLSLRTVVTEYDAALAISLYEENLVAMSTGNATANAYTGSHILHAVHKPHYSASFSALEVRIQVYNRAKNCFRFPSIL